MMSTKSITIVLTKKELRRSIRQRLARVNPHLTPQELMRISKHAVKVLRKIQDLPRYSQVINMTHRELNLVLQECPESPYFARDDYSTEEAEARKLVLEFVERAKFGCFSPLLEASSSKEGSQESINYDPRKFLASELSDSKEISSSFDQSSNQSIPML